MTTGNSLVLANAGESHAFWLPKVRLPLHCWALMGDEEGESEFDPRALGDLKKAFGLFQWHLPRAEIILAGCGIDVKTASHLEQLNAAYWEMRLSRVYGHVWGALMAAGTLWSAVTVLVHQYEGSLNQGSDVKRRVAMAERWEAHFGSVVS